MLRHTPPSPHVCSRALKILRAELTTDDVQRLIEAGGQPRPPASRVHDWKRGEDSRKYCPMPEASFLAFCRGLALWQQGELDLSVDESGLPAGWRIELQENATHPILLHGPDVTIGCEDEAAAKGIARQMAADVSE